MRWVAPSEKDAATATLEKRLWDAADQFRANSGLKSQEYSSPVLGLIFLRFAELRFAAQRAKLERGIVPPRQPRGRPRRLRRRGHPLSACRARFDYLLNRPEAENVLPFVPTPSLPRNIYWLHWATNGLVVFNDYKGHWPEFAAQTLVVPREDLCQRFGDFTAPLSRQILKLEHQIQNLRCTRNLLLPRLLSRQIDVEAA